MLYRRFRYLENLVPLLLFYYCYSAYIWISFKTKLSPNVEGGTYDSGNVALVWVSWPSTDMYVIIILSY